MMDNKIKYSIITLILLVGAVVAGILFSNLITLYFIYQKTGSTTSITNEDALFTLFNGTELLYLQLSSHVFGLILPAFIITQWRIKSDFAQRRFDAQLFLWSIIFFLCCLPLVSTSAWLNQQIPLPESMIQTEDKINELLNKILKLNNSNDLIFALITVAIIPGISEEWIFRGIVQNQSSVIFKNKYIGWLIASFIFAFIHFQFEGFLPRFLLGLILGFIYMQSASLWHSIILHMCFNGTQVLLLYFSGKEFIESQDSASKISTINGLAGLLVLPLVYFIAKQLTIKSKTEPYA